jgi:hypothetical protein
MLIVSCHALKVITVASTSSLCRTFCVPRALEFKNRTRKLQLQNYECHWSDEWLLTKAGTFGLSTRGKGSGKIRCAIMSVLSNFSSKWIECCVVQQTDERSLSLFKRFGIFTLIHISFSGVSPVSFIVNFELFAVLSYSVKLKQSVIWKKLRTWNSPWKSRLKRW